MPQGISVQIIGDDSGVQKMLAVLDTALNPVAIAGFLTGVVEPYVHERAEARFADEGDDVVGPWQPLKPATVAIRQAQGYGGAHPINVRTGELESYITEGPGNTLVHPFGATLTMPGQPATGDLADKVRTAQEGDTRTVARPVMGLNEQDLAFVLLALARHVGFVGRTLGVKTP